MDYLQADPVSLAQERKTGMTGAIENPAKRSPIRGENQRRLKYRLDCGRKVLVAEIRITRSTLGYLAEPAGDDRARDSTRRVGQACGGRQFLRVAIPALHPPTGFAGDAPKRKWRLDSYDQAFLAAPEY